jgi:hypothetical protein
MQEFVNVKRLYPLYRRLGELQVDKLVSAGIRSADCPDRIVSLNYVLPFKHTIVDPGGRVV